MCRVLKVHRSGYYAWLQEPLSPQAKADEALTLKISARFNRILPKQRERTCTLTVSYTDTRLAKQSLDEDKPFSQLTIKQRRQKAGIRKNALTIENHRENELCLDELTSAQREHSIRRGSAGSSLFDSAPFRAR